MNGASSALLLIDLHFQGQNFWHIISANISQIVKDSAKIAIAIRYLPSNGVTANVLHRDIDLYFQGHTNSENYIIFNIFKTVSASEICSSKSLIEFDTSH